MMQKLYNRLAELEKIRAAAVLRACPPVSPSLDSLLAFVNARAADPEFKRRLAEATPDLIRTKVREFRQQLMERAFSGGQIVAGCAK